MFSPRFNPLTPASGLLGTQEDESTQMDLGVEEGTLLAMDSQASQLGLDAEEASQAPPSAPAQQQAWGRLLPLRRGAAHIKLLPRPPETRKQARVACLSACLSACTRC